MAYIGRDQSHRPHRYHRPSPMRGWLSTDENERGLSVADLWALLILVAVILAGADWGWPR